MLTEVHQDFIIELARHDGGLSILPSPPSTPKEHRFQGGLIYVKMIDVEGWVLSPRKVEGRRLRVWLSQMNKWNFSPPSAPHIGDLYDRTDEIPNGGLEASLYIPEDCWPSTIHCLSTIWRRLALTGVNGDGYRMDVVDFSFSSFSSFDPHLSQRIGHLPGLPNLRGGDPTSPV